MFCGMGRLLGSILGGPLGALGRPPGASKLTRVFSHSMEGHDEDGETNVDCEPMAYTSAIIRLAKDDFCLWNRFKSCDTCLLGRRTFLARDPVFNPPIPHNLQVRGYDVVESKEFSIALLRSVFIHFATSSLKSVLSKGSWKSVVSTPPQSTSSSDNLRHHEANESDSFDSLQEKSEEVSLNLMDNIRQIETDLVNTQNQMIARVQGLQGIDLITEGNFSMGFKLLEKSAAAGDAESLYNLGVVYDSGWFKPKNLKRAKKYYEQAVLRDHAAAMYNLAILLDSKSHPQECEDLMKRAAKLGLPEAKALCELELTSS